LPEHDVQSRERFRRIYQAAYPRILGYALRRTSAPEDAADVVSETFLVAWRRFDDLPPGDESLLWLYGVAHRVLANQRRGERRRSALGERLAGELDGLVPGWHDPPPSDLAPFAAAWHRLRPQDRELLGFVAWEGLDNDQLAQVLGCSRTVLKLRLHRARRRFAQELAEADVEPGPPTAASGGPADDLTAPTSLSSGLPDEARPLRQAAADVALKPPGAAGHVLWGRASVCPGMMEAS